MLKLTRKVEYALIALRHLHAKTDSVVTNTKEIAETYEIPAPLLAKIMQQLARENLIEPIQGPNGGYRIKADLESIKMTDFIEILEGPLGLVDCFHDTECSQIDQCNIRAPIEKINKTIIDLFSNMTLADITSNSNK
jgi:Rrf2 family protein